MAPDQLRRKPRQHDRVILHFQVEDYDCFYASVFENQNPPLKSQPLGVKQKSILATCNYIARGRGVKKLMLISEARKLCPDLVIIDGEDLTPFRDVSKTLFSFLRSYSWNKRVERLGLDEVFMDVTDIVDFNLLCLNRASLSASFFHLSRADPEKGFECDLTAAAGCVRGAAPKDANVDDTAYLRILLGSHLANHLRLKLEEDFGFTSTCGISVNKLLSKMAGGENKPRNQTAMFALSESEVLDFMDYRPIRKTPGIGSRMTNVLETHLIASGVAAQPHTMDCTLMVHDIRTRPGVSPIFFEKLLASSGYEKGIGEKVWNLLHGIDDTEVKQANDIPSQISIEDTYRELGNLSHITDELKKLACSLIRRMRVDLVSSDETTDELPGQRWLARPRTLRLSVRSHDQNDPAAAYNGPRTSRSQPLPAFALSLKESIEHIAERLVSEALLPLLRRIYPEKGHQWNLQLINICAANIDVTGNETRDISIMFRRQDDVLRQWKIDTAITGSIETMDDADEQSEFQDDASDASWDDGILDICAQCGHSIPAFAILAHKRYHELAGQDLLLVND